MIKGTSAITIVDNIIATKGRHLHVVTPLGIGKPVLILNELYRRAKEGKLDQLTIFTALSMTPPTAGGDILSQRLFGPAYDRIYDGCPTLDFLVDRQKGELPDNVKIQEFYTSSGSVLHNEKGQQDFISVSYGQTLHYLRHSGFNVFVNLVADAGDYVDTSSNSDYGCSVIPEYIDKPLEERPYFACEINRTMPVFGPTSQIEKSKFDAILETEQEDYPIIALPSQPPNNAEYAIGIRVAGLIKDDGTLQIGIGRIGESLAWALRLRHHENDSFRTLYGALQPNQQERELIKNYGGMEPFEAGLHGSTEMFVEGIMQLYDAGIMTRLVDGVAINGGFFAGSNRFYQRLRLLTEEDRKKIQMRSIGFTNLLYGDEMQKREARKNARFVNQAMLFTTNGAACSDALADGRIVSGVGGQYEFVVQGNEIEDARSILMAISTRHRRGKFSSNIVSSYGYTTIPRHLRDIVVTEYGIADLRYKSDAEVVAAMIEISDREFQDQLRDEAIRSYKLPKSYQIPEHARRNTREWLNDQLRPFRKDGLIPLTPFGSQYTDVELGIIVARRAIAAVVDNVRNIKLPDLEGIGIKTILNPPESAMPYLERLDLVDPKTIEERVARTLLLYGLKAEDII